MEGFDNGAETSLMLDGVPVTAINADMSTGLDLTRAVPLKVNSGICFQGPLGLAISISTSIWPCQRCTRRIHTDWRRQVVGRNDTETSIRESTPAVGPSANLT